MLVEWLKNIQEHILVDVVEEHTGEHTSGGG